VGRITGRCQLACGHCYSDSGPRGTHGTMTAIDWMRVIDEAAGMGCRSMQLIGGEPTLHPALPAPVRHALR
jgi:MoaA/NifB/PqqE/SkfB family radical SAM enzyme